MTNNERTNVTVSGQHSSQAADPTRQWLGFGWNGDKSASTSQPLLHRLWFQHDMAVLISETFWPHTCIIGCFFKGKDGFEWSSKEMGL